MQVDISLKLTWVCRSATSNKDTIVLSKVLSNNDVILLSMGEAIKKAKFRSSLDNPPYQQAAGKNFLESNCNQSIFALNLVGLYPPN